MKTWAHLHLPRLWSGETPDVISLKLAGQRVEYVSWLSLSDAEFRVFQPGRQRCIRENVRNVHAWAVGTEVERMTNHWPMLDFPPEGWRTAVYDPFKGATFVDAGTLEPVLAAGFVILSGKNVWFRP